MNKLNKDVNELHEDAFGTFEISQILKKALT